VLRLESKPQTTDNKEESPGTLHGAKEWFERRFIVQKLRENGWNISKTAEVIDTPRSNLYKKLEQYNIRQETDG
jgi:two-component system nitrogen regulation response regulator NtrX